VRTIARAEAGTLGSRLIVAGGGGGSGVINQACGRPGDGAGGDAEADGRPGATCGGLPGGGPGVAGTQIAGGAGGEPGGGDGTFGQGGAAGYTGGGGGGGYYGGGAGGDSRDAGPLPINSNGGGGGGGGSNLVPPGGSAAIATGGAPQIVITYSAPGAIVATAGSGQSAVTGQAFAQPLVATVSDSDGNPLPNAPVTFTVATGAASFGGAAAATITTDAAGRATSPVLVAGSTPGPVTVTAATPGVTEPATFLASVTAAGPARADLSVALASPIAVARGQVFTVTLTLTNAGPSPASKVLSGITVPRHFTVVDAGGGTLRFGTVLYAADSLASGQTATFALRLRAGSRRAITALLAGALSGIADPRPLNNLTARVIRIT
jgi:hypothetical protein